MTWNGTTITSLVPRPVLIYIDELTLDLSANTIADPNSPGALICRSEDRATVSWHFIMGVIVRGPANSATDDFKAISTMEGATPSVSQLLQNRANFELTNTNLNGVWHCRLNAVGESGFEEQINVGIFHRGAGKGLHGRAQIV